MKPKIKAVLFDIDGVLIDSEEINIQTYHRILNSFGFDVSYAMIKEAMLGHTTHQIFEMLIPESPMAIRDEMVGLIAKNTHLSFLEFKPTQALEAVPELADNYLIGAVTNRRQSAFEVLNHFGVLGYFSTVKTADTHTPKPSPNMIHGACAELKVSAKETVFFGDNNVDLEAGVRAGVDTRIIDTKCTRKQILGLLKE